MVVNHRHMSLTSQRGAGVAELESTYRSGYAELLRVTAAICGSRDLARDAVHDAFVGLLRGRESYRGEGTIEAWAWRAVVNAARRIAATRPTPEAAGRDRAEIALCM